MKFVCVCVCVCGCVCVCVCKWEEELIKVCIWPESSGCMKYWFGVLKVNFALQSERNARSLSFSLTFNTITGLLQFL